MFKYKRFKYQIFFRAHSAYIKLNSTLMKSKYPLVLILLMYYFIKMHITFFI